MSRASKSFFVVLLRRNEDETEAEDLWEEEAKEDVDVDVAGADSMMASSVIMNASSSGHHLHIPDISA